MPNARRGRWSGGYELMEYYQDCKYCGFGVSSQCSDDGDIRRTVNSASGQGIGLSVTGDIRDRLVSMIIIALQEPGVSWGGVCDIEDNCTQVFSERSPQGLHLFLTTTGAQGITLFVRPSVRLSINFSTELSLIKEIRKKRKQFSRHVVDQGPQILREQIKSKCRM